MAKFSNNSYNNIFKLVKKENENNTEVLGVAGLLGTTYMFVKGGLPNNEHQNQ